MKFKVGDKVINQIGLIGKITEVLDFGCYVLYTDKSYPYAIYEYNHDLQKPKHITLAQASKSAEREKAEQERVIEITEKFIRCLGR